MTISKTESQILETIQPYSRGLRGYQIAKKIKKLVELLYPVFDKLENEGFIESYWGKELTGNGYRTRYYKITDSGTRELTKYIESQINEDFNGLLHPS